MKYDTTLYKIWHWLAGIPPKIMWSRKRKLTDAQKEELAKLLATGYYVILTGTRSHLSSVIVSFMTWVKLGSWSRYSHALMNCDFMERPEDKDKFKFVEATSVGVHYSTFDDVFDCDYVCLLSPVRMHNEDWTVTIDALVENNGKPYDDLFDLSDTSRMSCVEVVLSAFRKNFDYSLDFPELEVMIAYEKNLLPEMYRQCGDFKVVFEA